jgi:hypothetical protein
MAGREPVEITVETDGGELTVHAGLAEAVG